MVWCATEVMRARRRSDRRPLTPGVIALCTRWLGGFVSEPGVCLCLTPIDPPLRSLPSSFLAMPCARRGTLRGTGSPDEADLPTEPNSPPAQSRLPGPDEHARGPGRDQAAARQGPQAPQRLRSHEVAMVRAGAYLRRADRLRSPRDYRRVNEQGTRAASPNFVLLAAPRRVGSAEGRPRLGITVTRRVGNAVTRNHVKRRVRECFRRCRDELGRPLDVVVIARKGAAMLEAQQVESELAELFRGCSR